MSRFVKALCLMLALAVVPGLAMAQNDHEDHGAEVPAVAHDEEGGHAGHGAEVSAVAKEKGEEKKLPKPQATCPVMGGKINPALFVEQNGERIYMCCPGCKKKIGDNFGTFSKKLKAEGTALKVQTVCPVMGRPIDRDLFVEQGGERIYTCCKACIAKVKADFPKVREGLLAKGIAPQPVKQAKGEADKHM